MELILKRIAKKKDYTIGRLSLSPNPSPVGRGDGNHNSNTDIKASPVGRGDGNHNSYSNIKASPKGEGLVGALASPTGGGLEGASYFLLWLGAGSVIKGRRNFELRRWMVELRRLGTSPLALWRGVGGEAPIPLSKVLEALGQLMMHQRGKDLLQL